MSSLCIECRRGFPCLSTPSCSNSAAIIPTIEVEASDDNDTETPDPKPRARNQKRDAALKDQQSTGRKRAARQYPLDRDSACEWKEASVSNPMGGGTKPITVGCDRLQLNRHHGPDKNTLNNEQGNVHRICSHHHNQWHAANDPDYVPGQVLRD